jgi:hypothetical protein
VDPHPKLLENRNSSQCKTPAIQVITLSLMSIEDGNTFSRFKGPWVRFLLSVNVVTVERAYMCDLWPQRLLHFH